jgi:hypothetical protein
LNRDEVLEVLDLRRRTGGRVGDGYLFIVKRFKGLNSLKQGKQRKMKKMNLAGGKC